MRYPLTRETGHRRAIIRADASLTANDIAEIINGANEDFLENEPNPEVFRHDTRITAVEITEGPERAYLETIRQKATGLMVPTGNAQNPTAVRSYGERITLMVVRNNEPLDAHPAVVEAVKKLHPDLSESEHRELTARAQAVFDQRNLAQAIDDAIQTAADEG